MPTFRDRQEEPASMQAKILMIYGVLAILGFLSLVWFKSKFLGMTWNWGWAAVWFLFFDLILSLRKVNEDELGAIMFFGRPLWEVKSGPVIVPFLLFYLRKDTRNTIQLELPGEPEEVQKFDEDNILPGRKAPIRITQPPAEGAVFYNEDGGEVRKWSNLPKEEKEDILKDPMHRRVTTEASIIVRWRIKHYIPFLKNIGSVAAANRQIEDTAVASAQDELGIITAAHAISRKALISLRIRSAVEKLVREEEALIISDDDGSWGIDVSDTQLKLLDPGETVNKAAAKAAASVSAREETITTAQGEKQKLILTAQGEEERLTREGAGKAAARQALLEAEALGIAKLAEIAKSENGQIVLHLQTIREGLAGSNYSIVPTESFLGSLAAVQEVLDKTKSKKVPTAT